MSILSQLTQFICDPIQVASVVPSSTYLEARVVRLANVGKVKTLVELGPGMGAITRGLLRGLSRNGRLIAVEINDAFAHRLQQDPDPRLSVHCDSAANLCHILKAEDSPPPDCIVSGIPFSTLSPREHRRLFAMIWSCLAPGGRFIAYQLRDAVAVVGEQVVGVTPHTEFELFNLPPVHIYNWSKPVEKTTSDSSVFTRLKTPVQPR